MAISISNPAIRGVGVSSTGATLYELVEPLTVVMEVGIGEIRITVPAGFVTDLATVPRVLWPLMAPSGQHQLAAIVHDYLYQCVGAVSRFLADAIFRDLMAHLDVPLWRRVSAYYAVRAFGGRHWTA
jgi:hypothetical protein